MPSHFPRPISISASSTSTSDAKASAVFRALVSGEEITASKFHEESRLPSASRLASPASLSGPSERPFQMPSAFA
jgi:hypothetical protein